MLLLLLSLSGDAAVVVSLVVANGDVVAVVDAILVVY